MPADGQQQKHPDGSIWIYDSDKRGYIGPYWYSPTGQLVFGQQQAAAPAADPYASFYGVYGIVPGSPQAQVILDAIKFDETDGEGIGAAAIFDAYAQAWQTGPYAPKPPTGGSGLAYSSTAASQAQAEAFAAAEAEKARQYQAEQERLQREWQMEQDRLAREEQARQARLGVLTDLITNFASNQQKSRELLFQLGPDPFKFAAGFQGMANRGTTPQQAFSNQLTEYSGRPLPTVDPNAPKESIDAAINKIAPGGIIPGLPVPAAQWGLASGGTIKKDNKGQPTRVMVGERGPEMLEVDKDSVKVIPNHQLPMISRPMYHAAEGGDFTFDDVSMAPAVSALYQGLGMGGQDIPKVNTFEHGYTLPNSGLYKTLGIQPSLIRDHQTGQAYWRNAQGQLQPITSQAEFDAAGFDWADFANVPTSGLSQMGTISNTIFDDAMMKDIPQGQTNPLGPYGNVLNTTAGKFALPAPIKVLSILRQMERDNPFFFNMLMGGYEDAGFPANTIKAQMDEGAVQGVTQNTRRLIGFR